MNSKEKFTKLGEVLRFFEEISAIPRGSGNTKAIADHLVKFASERGLEYHRDESDNVIIKKAATAGYEFRPTVILQGHTDIVAEKRAGCTVDMEREGVRLVYDGDFLRADGTTLGADNGIAVAYAMAILDSKNMEHPAIEAVFTSDEEIGLLGAGALDTGLLSGRVMINIDSDDEGIFTVGCAGGVRVDLKIPADKAAPYPYAYRIMLGGLLGGHSGMEIDKGRENAIKIMGELLSELPGLRISSLSGGNADNAIARECEATVTLPEPIGAAKDRMLDIAEKYRAREAALSLEITEVRAERAIGEKLSARIVTLINDSPSGVVAMSRDIEGLVETSLNMGVLRLGDNFELSFSVRSSKGAEKDAVVLRLKGLAEKAGAEFSTRGAYPAWEYRKESHLRDVMCEVYERMYGKAAKVVTIHAGLECGLFSDKMEGLDCVSIGPDNFDLHTPDEHLSLPSAERVWEYLGEVLRSV